MTRVFITGSADGLGRAAAQTLIEDGHEIVVHARSADRLAAVRDLLDLGAAAVVRDLADLEETRGVADQVNRLGPMDAVIHNAGVVSGPHVLPVNVVAPYVLTALIDRPQTLGGAGAPDDLRLGHLTQEWLAASDDAEARMSGGFWHHQRRTEPAPATRDERFQDDLLRELARFTAVPLARHEPKERSCVEQ